MIPHLEREIVDRKRWMTDQELAEVVALAGSVPGAMAINTATFVGYRKAKLMGAAMATIGILIPTMLIMIALSVAYSHYDDHPKVIAAYQGIVAGVTALIIYASYRIARVALCDVWTWAFMIIVFLLLLFTSLHPAILIVSGLAIGLIYVQCRK